MSELRAVVPKPGELLRRFEFSVPHMSEVGSDEKSRPDAVFSFVLKPGLLPPADSLVTNIETSVKTRAMQVLTENLDTSIEIAISPCKDYCGR